MAACIGREFSHELLGAVSSLSDSALRGRTGPAARRGAGLPAWRTI